MAIANAKLAFQRYQELFATPRWRALDARGARTQRLLWASTGTKDASYRDVVYVEELVGPDTVNTIPPPTLTAFQDHGRPRASLTEDLDGAFDTMCTLAETGISLKATTDALLTEGLQLFTDAFRKFAAVVAVVAGPERRASSSASTARLPPAFETAVEQSLAEWQAHGKVRRLWARDATLWTGSDEAQWLGWLGITNGQLAPRSVHRHSRGRADRGLGRPAPRHGRLEPLPRRAEADLRPAAGVPRAARPRLHRSGAGPQRREPDRPGGDAVHRVEQVGLHARAGHLQAVFLRARPRAAGTQQAGRRFIAITDPGSKLQQIAEMDGFRQVFAGWPDIGGRCSALSDFGLVPAAMMGIDIAKFLDRADEMVSACIPSITAEENPVSCWARFSASARAGSAATSSPSSRHRGWPRSAPGSNNW